MERRLAPVENFMMRLEVLSTQIREARAESIALEKSSQAGLLKVVVETHMHEAEVATLLSDIFISEQREECIGLNETRQFNESTVGGQSAGGQQLVQGEFGLHTAHGLVL